MGNVLGTLFGDIATAIRSKTGDTATMKPAEFPDKISAIEVGIDTAEIDNILDEINGELVGEIELLEGSCGVSVTYSLRDSGVLRITGSGEITSTPWLELEDYIETVIVEDGVTIIPQDCFVSCNNLSSVTLGNTVEYIGFGAFNSCTNLKSITIPASVKDILYYAFTGCTVLTSVIFEDASGWKAYEEVGDGYVSFTSSDLANPVTAATYLTGIADGEYGNCWWRNDS